jgi:hypothetical protein
MKALALLTAAALTLLSVAATAQTYGTPYGKGKAPPPPAGCYQRLVRAIGGTGHRAGPFPFWIDADQPGRESG